MAADLAGLSCPPMQSMHRRYVCAFFPRHRASGAHGARTRTDPAPAVPLRLRFGLPRRAASAKSALRLVAHTHPPAHLSASAAAAATAACTLPHVAAQPLRADRNKQPNMFHLLSAGRP